MSGKIDIAIVCKCMSIGRITVDMCINEFNDGSIRKQLFHNYRFYGTQIGPSVDTTFCFSAGVNTYCCARL